MLRFVLCIFGLCYLNVAGIARFKYERRCEMDSGNRAFSLTWPASTLIYCNKRKHLHEKRVELPQDWFGTPTWPPFHCFGTSIWPPWRHVKTLYTSEMTPSVNYRVYIFNTSVLQCFFQWRSSPTKSHTILNSLIHSDEGRKVVYCMSTLTHLTGFINLVDKTKFLSACSTGLQNTRWQQEIG